MATLDAYGQLTLLELAKRKDPNGDAASIAEIMTETNEILIDAVWGEANNTTTHKVVRRDSLPSGSWRSVNSGVAKEASTTTEVNEPIGLLESYSEVDKLLVDIAPSPTKFRMDEASAFIEGMSQTLSDSVIYGDATTSPKEFTGLAARLDGLGERVIGCSGTGDDLTSIYVVQWGLNRIFMVYPKNSKDVGIAHKDLGEVTLEDADGNLYQGYRDHFIVKPGLVVKDTRSIARVCNIESAGASNLFNEDKLIQALNFMPQAGKGATIYVNRTVKTQMEIALVDRANVNFTTANGLGGLPVTLFRGCPVRTVESILNTESAIS